jgi:hypothetical protein
MSKKYKPFDGSDESFELKIDSNANIKKIGEVLTACYDKDQPERVYYAKHCEIPPESVEDGQATYNLENLYSISMLWPALAQELFYGFPTLVEVNDGEAAVVDQKKKEKLIRSQVMAGRDDFLGTFGVTSYEASSLLSELAGGLNFPSINRILDGGLPPREEDFDSTKETS